MSCWAPVETGDKGQSGFVPQAADLSKAPTGQALCYPLSLFHVAPLCSCLVIAVPLFLQLGEVF